MMHNGHFVLTETEPAFDGADALRFGRDIYISLSHVCCWALMQPVFEKTCTSTHETLKFTFFSILKKRLNNVRSFRDHSVNLVWESEQLFIGIYNQCHEKLVMPNTHTHPFNGPFSGTTRVSRYQKGKTNLDFTEARDSEWQWHQLGHMQVCTSLQTDNHASTPLLSFLQAGCPSCRPTNSVKALKA